MTDNRISVIVKSNTKDYYIGEAVAVSSTNNVGNFDVLFEHSNFVTVVKDYVDVYKNMQNKIRFEFDRGILHVRNNQVEVFVGI